MLPKITRPFCMEENMKSRTKYISLVIMIVLALSLAACERSASPAPQEPLPTPEISGMDLVEQMLAAEGEDGLDDSEPTEGQPLDSLPPLGEDQQPVEDAEPTEQEPAPAVEPQPLVETVRPATYTLQRGEFPYCIARRFNVAPSELMALNGLTAAQSRALQPGLVLQIPQTGNPFPGTRALQPHPTTYTVQSSTETIYAVACKFGDVDPVNIANQNGLVAPYTLTFGQVLNIP
jgi:hypothetical protein